LAKLKAAKGFEKPSTNDIRFSLHCILSPLSSLVSFDEEVQLEHWEQGKPQPPKCHRVTFAILFLVQLGVVFFFAIKYFILNAKGVQPYKPNGDMASHFLYFNLAAYLALFSLMVAKRYSYVPLADRTKID
jgi:hypothetical protein